MNTYPSERKSGNLESPLVFPESRIASGMTGVVARNALSSPETRSVVYYGKDLKPETRPLFLFFFQTKRATSFAGSRPFQ